MTIGAFLATHPMIHRRVDMIFDDFFLYLPTVAIDLAILDTPGFFIGFASRAKHSGCLDHHLDYAFFKFWTAFDVIMRVDYWTLPMHPDDERFNWQESANAQCEVLQVLEDQIETKQGCPRYIVGDRFRPVSRFTSTK